MTFSELKTEILSRLKRLELCDAYYDAMAATTHAELIAAGMPLVVWSYQADVVDDALLSEFTESDLNAEGIFTAGSFTIANPSLEIFVMKEANVTLNISLPGKYKINPMGESVVMISAGSNSFLTVKGYDQASITIATADTAVVNVELTENSEATINTNDDSVVHVIGRSKSQTELIQNNNSYCLATLYLEATLNYILNDSAIFEGTAYNQSIITATTV